MTKGSEIPFRRSRHDRDTGSLVFDQERKAALEESSADGKPHSRTEASKYAS